MAVGAFVLTYLIYERGSISLDSTRQRFAPILKVVENKYYFDEIYQWTIDQVVLRVANFVGFFDRAGVNDVGVNGPATWCAASESPCGCTLPGICTATPWPWRWA